MENKILKSLYPIVEAINNAYDKLHSLTNDEFRVYCNGIKIEINKSDDKDILDKYLIEVFAIVKETARRFARGDVKVTANDFDKQIAEKYDFVDIIGNEAIYHHEWKVRGILVSWNMIHYDVQIMAGVLLHRGYAIEMATGEGKTLAATLPAFLNGIQHKGVHIQTVNDYLSKRDCEQMRPLYYFHGLTADCIEYYEGNKRKRRNAYESDICFGSNASFVFDYLRDNKVKSIDDKVQAGLNYTIIDELDSILIDRASVPYIISGEELESDFQELLKKYNDIVAEIVGMNSNDKYFSLDPITKNILFTEEAIKWFRNRLDLELLFSNELAEKSNSDDPKIRAYANEINNIGFAILILLHAYLVLRRDVDYLVSNNKIIIINPDTGRPEYSTRWEHGIHTAVELKEKVPCKNESSAEATISLGNYLRLYNKYSGMSGTIAKVSDELKRTYGLDCAVIPTFRPCIRKDHNLRVFKTKDEKYKAFIATVTRVHKLGRPILISCTSTHQSEVVFEMLQKNKLNVRLLNAKNLEKEAFTISHAGEDNSIMISTAIAGRGTDIKLTKTAKEAGGLYVIGTELFNSSRIDNQLRGRAGRQGDPGDSVFFVSFEDAIMDVLSEEERRKMKEESTVQNSLNCKVIRKWFFIAQEKEEIEQKRLRDFGIEKDNALNEYRKQFYESRNMVLGEPLTTFEYYLELAKKKYNVEQDYLEVIKKLYEQVCIIFKNALNNNIVGMQPIIFSANKELFFIGFDVQKTVDDYNYFRFHFVQRLCLYIYDRYWYKLVNQVLNKLIVSKEEVENWFNYISEEMDNSVLRLLFRCVIPINFDNISKEEKEGANNAVKFKETPLLSIINISADAPCPCKSGKTYGECHGRNIRHNRGGGRFN